MVVLLEWGKGAGSGAESPSMFEKNAHAINPKRRERQLTRL
jgi:hypothetical protein